MTIPPTNPTQPLRWSERERTLAEVQAIQERARRAIDRLDPAGAIAEARALRSALWHAEREGVSLTEPNQEGA
jgi:hypothetical protein